MVVRKVLGVKGMHGQDRNQLWTRHNSPLMPWEANCKGLSPSQRLDLALGLPQSPPTHASFLPNLSLFKRPHLLPLHLALSHLASKP